MPSKNFIRKTSLPGLLIIERPTFFDERGFFREFARLSDLEQEGIKFHPVQFNHSKSLPGVIRGLHAEQWNKLVYPVTGEMFAALVDVRSHLDTFGKVETLTLKADNPLALFIPQGVANSICVTGKEPVHYIYLADKYYQKPGMAIAWNDPDLAIDWPVKNPIISKRDRNNPRLRELFPEQFT